MPRSATANRPSPPASSSTPAIPNAQARALDPPPSLDDQQRTFRDPARRRALPEAGLQPEFDCHRGNREHGEKRIGV